MYLKFSGLKVELAVLSNNEFVVVQDAYHFDSMGAIGNSGCFKCFDLHSHNVSLSDVLCLLFRVASYGNMMLQSKF